MARSWLSRSPQFSTHPTVTATPPMSASYSRQHVIAPHCASLANIKCVSRIASRSSYAQKITATYQVLAEMFDSGQGTKDFFLAIIFITNTARVAIAAAMSLRADQTRASSLRQTVRGCQGFSSAGKRCERPAACNCFKNQLQPDHKNLCFREHIPWLRRHISDHGWNRMRSKSPIRRDGHPVEFVSMHLRL